MKKLSWNVIHQKRGESPSVYYTEDWEEAQAVYWALAQIQPKVKLVVVETNQDTLEQNFEGDFDNEIYLDLKI